MLDDIVFERQFKIDQHTLCGCCDNVNPRKLHLYRLGEHYRIYCTSCHAIVDNRDYNTAVEMYRQSIYDILPIKDIIKSPTTT